MTLRNALEEKKFIITCELAPPKGTDVSALSNLAASLKGKVDAANLTDGQGGNMRMCPLAASSFVLKEGVDVIWQLTCRDRNRIALQSDCLGASALGVRNVLPMRGDDPKGGDNPEAVGVFDLNTTELIKMISGLNNGLDMPGKELKGNTEFNIGCPAHPALPDLKKQYETLKERFELGASFMQTQISYDVEQIKKFIDSLGELAPKTILGVTPLKSLKMASFMNDKVFGVSVSDEIMKRIEGSSDQREEGLQVSKEIVNTAKDMGIGGIHVMAVGQEGKLPEVIDFLTSDIKAKV